MKVKPMIINGKTLLNLAPLANMEPEKQRFKGTSFGLSEAGYDIRLKQDIIFMRRQNDEMYHSVDHGPWEKGRFTLASAIEEFQMPPHLVGTIKDKSTWARQGISVFNTVAEPGWNGFLTLELVYHCESTLYMYAGQGIAQVLFAELAEDGDYGDGKYQNQEDKPITARN